MANLKKIREICENKRITLKDLSEKIGISQNGLQRIMKDNATKIDTLEKIAEALQVPITTFFYEDLKDPSTEIKDLEIQLQGFKTVHESWQSKMTLYRSFLRQVEKHIELVESNDGTDGTNREIKKSLIKVQLYIDFLKIYDSSFLSLNPEAEDKQLMTWIAANLANIKE